jgi:hypothetical protein
MRVSVLIVATVLRPLRKRHSSNQLQATRSTTPNRCIKALRNLRVAVQSLDLAWDYPTVNKATSELLEARGLNYDLSLGWPEIARELCAWCDIITLDAKSCDRCSKPVPLAARFCPYCSSDLAFVSQGPQRLRVVDDPVERRNQCLKALRDLKVAAQSVEVAWHDPTMNNAEKALLEHGLTPDGAQEMVRDLCSWCDIIHERCHDAEEGYPVGKIRLM